MSSKRLSLFSITASQKRRRLEYSVDESELVATPMKKNSSTIQQGRVLVLGQGDTGQLGLGPDIFEKSKPTPLDFSSLAKLREDSFIKVCAGGMHSVCLTIDGQVVTFGCNDEGALGRITSGKELEEDIETKPGFVVFPSPLYIINISAGDSHSAAIDDTGNVWIWGTFRGSSGPIGLTKSDEIAFTPVQVCLPGRTKEIASGSDHLVCLLEDGRVYTLGCGEQGQLGRLAERFAKDGGRKGIEMLLQPAQCRIRGGFRSDKIWAGSYATFVRCAKTGAIYSCGLNNYGQLGLSVSTNNKTKEMPNSNDADSASMMQFMLVSARGFNISKRLLDVSVDTEYSSTPASFRLHNNSGDCLLDANGWCEIAVGQHHTIALDKKAHVYAIGRSDYGRLGVEINNNNCTGDVSQLTPVVGLLSGQTCKQIACGTACSFAVDSNGCAYSWGMGSSGQLSAKDEEDVLLPQKMLGKQLTDSNVLMVSAGGQHTMLLVQSRKNNPNDSSLIINQ